MSQINALTIDIAQSTDTTGVSQGTSHSDSGKSNDFSQLMADQRVIDKAEKNGSAAPTSGKNQEEHQSVDDNQQTNDEKTVQVKPSEQNQNTADKATNDNNEVSTNESADSEIKTTASDVEKDKKLTEQQTKEVPNNKDKSALELLAFLNAADKVSTEHTNKIDTNNSDKNSSNDRKSVPMDLVRNNQQPDNSLPKGYTLEAALVKEMLLAEGEGKANGEHGKSLAGEVAKNGKVSSEQLVAESNKTNSQQQAIEQLLAGDSKKANESSIAEEVLETSSAQSKQTQIDLPKVKSASINDVAEKITKENATQQQINTEPEVAITDQVEIAAADLANAKNKDYITPIKSEVVKEVSQNQQSEKNNVVDITSSTTLAKEAVDDPVQNINAQQAVMAESKIISNEKPSTERVINQSTAEAVTSKQQNTQQQFSQQGNQQSNQESHQKNEQYNTVKSSEAMLEQEKQVEIKVGQNVENIAASTTKATERSAHIPSLLTPTETDNVQTLLAKAGNDAISVQSAKSVQTIHQETLSIYRKDFANEVKEKVMVMINQRIKQLEIRLDPPELGSMQVKVNLQNEQAAVSFVVQNQQAKEAIEQNINKLRDMLSESGVDVGEANIEQRDAKTGDDKQQSDENGRHGNGSEAAEDEQIDLLGRQNLYKASSTGVDYYA